MDDVLLLREVMVAGSPLVTAEVSRQSSVCRKVELAYIRVAWAPLPSFTDPSPNIEIPSHGERDVAFHKIRSNHFDVAFNVSLVELI